jgi:hypothetical protein
VGSRYSRVTFLPPHRAGNSPGASVAAAGAECAVALADSGRLESYHQPTGARFNHEIPPRLGRELPGGRGGKVELHHLRTQASAQRQFMRWAFRFSRGHQPWPRWAPGLSSPQTGTNMRAGRRASTGPLWAALAVHRPLVALPGPDQTIVAVSDTRQCRNSRQF